MQRYFTNKLIDNKFILNEDDLYHIRVVMRYKHKDLVEVVYNNELYIGRLNIINKDIEVFKEDKLDQNINNEYNITLIVPVLKETKFNLIIEKVTELGINKIIPITTERTIVKLDKQKEEKRLERWSKIIKEASEQSKRLSIPTITSIKTIKDLNNLEGLKILCSTVEHNITLKDVLKENNKKDIYFIVGPEGGLSPSEEEQLVSYGFISTKLTDTILRVETAPIYVLSNINYEYK